MLQWPCCQAVLTHAFLAMHWCGASGHTDVDTREWPDGVLTAAARAVAKQPLEQRSWIICDGDVDPEWIESLNSVLDDNRSIYIYSMLLDHFIFTHQSKIRQERQRHAC